MGRKGGYSSSVSGLDEGFGHQVAYDGSTLFIASDKNVFSYELDDCTP